MVLTDIKKLIGFDETYTAFDTDILIHINSTLSLLEQIGVDVTSKLTSNGNEDWDDILGDDVEQEMIKEYIYLKTRLVFDPPLNSSILESIKESIREYEWRINTAVETDDDNSESTTSDSEYYTDGYSDGYQDGYTDGSDIWADDGD